MLDYSALPYDDIKPNVANKGEAVSDEPQRTIMDPASETRFLTG